MIHCRSFRGMIRERPPHPCFKARCPSPEAHHVLAVLGFLGFFSVYCSRVGFNLALVAMVNSTSPASGGPLQPTDDSAQEDRVISNSTVADRQGKQGEFSWDQKTQGLILGAFYYGYVLTQLPGGWLADRVGGKWVMGGGALLSCLLTLLTPLTARTCGASALIALRVLQGLAEGVTTPAMYVLWASWAPAHERSRLALFAWSGGDLGAIAVMPLAGVLCEVGFAGGWPSVSYVNGIMGCVWFVLWSFLVYDSPAQHPRISAREKLYIHNSLGSAKDGVLSGLPNVAVVLSQMTSGWVADYVTTRRYMTTVNIRKGISTLGSTVTACCLVAVGYSGCRPALAVTLLVLASLGIGITMSVCVVNQLDIAPRFAGTLMGITNGIGNTSGFLASDILGVLTNNNQTSAQWRVFFYLSAGLYVCGAAVFLWQGQGEEQPWAANRRRPQPHTSDPRTPV